MRFFLHFPFGVFIATANATSCSTFVNTVIGKDYIAGGSGSTQEECCASCLKTKKCKAWTLSGTECWLKDNVEVVKAAGCEHPGTSCTSGIIPGLPTPPPPPPTPPTPKPSPPPPTPAADKYYGCLGANALSYPFCNTSLDLETRVNDLVERIAVDEMASQVCRTTHTHLDPLCCTTHLTSHHLPY